MRRLAASARRRRREVNARHPEGLARGHAHRGQVLVGLVYPEAPPVPAPFEGERPAGHGHATWVLRRVDDHPPGLGRGRVVLHPHDDRADAHAAAVRGALPPQVAALGTARVGDEAHRREERLGNAPAAGRGPSGHARRGPAPGRSLTYRNGHGGTLVQRPPANAKLGDHAEAAGRPPHPVARPAGDVRGRGASPAHYEPGWLYLRGRRRACYQALKTTTGSGQASISAFIADRNRSIIRP